MLQVIAESHDFVRLVRLGSILYEDERHLRQIEQISYFYKKKSYVRALSGLKQCWSRRSLGNKCAENIYFVL